MFFIQGGEEGSSEEPIYSEIEDEHTYLDILPEDDGYEVPRKPDKDNTYTEILPDDDGYEVPKKPSYDDHIYESIRETEDYNMRERPKHSTTRSGSREKRSSSNKIQAIDNDYYYVNKGSGMVIRKTSGPTMNDSQNVIDASFDELYANADAVSPAKEHRGHLPKIESLGFQPLLSPTEKGRLEVKKSDFHQLAKIILKTSKSEADAWAGNQVPNLEELGYDVSKLSKVIEKLSEKTRLDETSEENLEVPSRSKIAQERRFSENVSKLPKSIVIRNVLGERKGQDMTLRVKDFDFKSRSQQDEKNAENVRKSSGKVSSDSKVQKSTSQSQRRISKASFEQSDVDTDFSADTDTKN
ncbi:unnamed protein product [Larinioides sclopetarius]|uniref:Uncharacterized protein n=1 Tax=Larinioides sclopetarius TaxID=280406 RepID=A0AAV2A027_9ARAC